MKTVDIVETIAECIEKKIFGEWKHEGYIDGTSSEQVLAKIDGKEYVISIAERSTAAERLLEKYSEMRQKA